MSSDDHIKVLISSSDLQSDSQSGDLHSIR